jgi:hypothetical protein
VGGNAMKTSIVTLIIILSSIGVYAQKIDSIYGKWLFYGTKNNEDRIIVTSKIEILEIKNNSFGFLYPLPAKQKKVEYVYNESTKEYLVYFPDNPEKDIAKALKITIEKSSPDNPVQSERLWLISSSGTIDLFDKINGKDYLKVAKEMKKKEQMDIPDRYIPSGPIYEKTVLIHGPFPYQHSAEHDHPYAVILVLEWLGDTSNTISPLRMEPITWYKITCSPERGYCARVLMNILRPNGISESALFDFEISWEKIYKVKRIN